MHHHRRIIPSWRDIHSLATPQQCNPGIPPLTDTVWKLGATKNFVFHLLRIQISHTSVSSHWHLVLVIFLVPMWTVPLLCDVYDD